MRNSKYGYHKTWITHDFDILWTDGKGYSIVLLLLFGNESTEPITGQYYDTRAEVDKARNDLEIEILR